MEEEVQGGSTSGIQRGRSLTITMLTHKPHQAALGYAAVTSAYSTNQGINRLYITGRLYFTTTWLMTQGLMMEFEKHSPTRSFLSETSASGSTERLSKDCEGDISDYMEGAAAIESK